VTRKSAESLCLVIPVYNDWASFGQLVRELDTALSDQPYQASVIAVDDGSTEPDSDLQGAFAGLANLVRVEIVRLARNLGHQRAIAVGLSHAVRKYAPDRVAVMDSDGEDRPGTLPELLRRSGESGSIVFAKRSKRREGAAFLAFYGLYRALFQILTGRPIAFGNYCAMPGDLAATAVMLPELWNHFAAGIMRSRLPRAEMGIPRGLRYFGKSKMKFVDLVLHGLSAISVYTDILAVRLILFITAIIAGVVSGGVLLLYVRYFTSLAIPGWATTVAFGLLIILFQALMFLTLVCFLVLGARNARTVVPVRHYRDFLLGSRIVHGKA
jgi:glycosyltransferase involved in cell wall biosynthesis